MHIDTLIKKERREIFLFLSEVFGVLMPVLLIFTGLYFGCITRVFYLRRPIKTLKMMFRRKKDGISPFRAASMALAGTLGVGNITGVTAAIAMGGAGSVFWMWCSAMIAMPVKYAETVLAVLYRRKGSGGYYGGAPYYISEGLPGKRFPQLLGGVFAIFCILNSLTVGNILQVNAASSASEYTAGIPRIVCGFLIAALTLVSVLGGVKRISAITSFLIPLVSVVYMLLCAVVIFGNADLIPTVIRRIFNEAFSLDSALGGVGGYGIVTAVRYGVTRGVLTNEAGSGTSPTAHAAADSTSPMAQGCLGIFEVFADTILICSMTAFAILIGEERGMILTDDAMGSAVSVFERFVGNSAPYILTFSVFVFVFATLIAQYYYGKTALYFLTDKKRFTVIYTAVFFASAIYGSVISPSLMWELSDITVGVMTTVNVICLLFMKEKVKANTKM